MEKIIETVKSNEGIVYQEQPLNEFMQPVREQELKNVKKDIVNNSNLEAHSSKVEKFLDDIKIPSQCSKILSKWGSVLISVQFGILTS